MKKIILLLVAVFSFSGLFAGISVDVKIFTGYRIIAMKATPVIGKYSLYSSDKKIAEVLKNETVEIAIIGSYGVQLRKGGIDLGVFSTVTLSGEGLINEVDIKPVSPEVKDRVYNDDIRVSVVGGALLIINHVNVENYVAGVVQAEGGGSIRDKEFYIVQAICCRTYALGNVKKHIKEGFNLCDSIHCQHYMGVCRNSDILMAVFQTAGDVIVDKEGRMISAAFHANSGGQTVNSEDVWTIPTSYLKSVNDTFSLSMPDARWEKRIKTSEWLELLSSKYQVQVNDPAKRNAVLNFDKPQRQVFLIDSVRLTSLRGDFGLRSAFFSVKESGDSIILSGKGYGHGAGMSQQGAIHMTELGYSFRDIIKFYYQGTDIVNYEQLIIKNN